MGIFTKSVVGLEIDSTEIRAVNLEEHRISQNLFHMVVNPL